MWEKFVGRGGKKKEEEEERGRWREECEYNKSMLVRRGAMSVKLSGMCNGLSSEIF